MSLCYPPSTIPSIPPSTPPLASTRRHLHLQLHQTSSPSPTPPSSWPSFVPSPPSLPSSQLQYLKVVRLVLYLGGGGDGGFPIDDMPKSQIEKRKRNMETLSPVSRREREMSRSSFWFEKRTRIIANKIVRNLQKKNLCGEEKEKCKILASFEKRKRIFGNKSEDSRGYIEKLRFQFFVTRKRNSPSRKMFRSHFCFIFNFLY